VVVNFFASWCTNCRAEMPLLQRVAGQEKGRGLVVVPVSWHESGDSRTFLHDLGISLPALLDRDSRVGDAYGVSDLPETVFIGRDGRVTEIFRGQLSEETLSAALGGLLGAAPSG
jgi:thiol-disulfide isomerase/thioredoxin